MGGKNKNPTAAVSLADTDPCDVNCLMEKERLPDLCPVNCENKTCSCYSFGSKSKELDDSSEPTNEASNENDGHVSMTLWESFATLFIPFLLQSLCGGVHIVRSIFVTYVLQTLLKSDSWADSKLYRTIMSLSPEGSLPSWPPPSLVFLAALTITALIIHPDGFTWIALRKLRGSLLYLFESSSTCWAWVLNDFGSVVSTLLAITTFASLFFFCYLLHRTLRPRSNQKLEAASKGTSTSSPSPEKSRRKRRKGKNDKSRGSKQTTSPRAQSPQPTEAPSPPSVIVDRAPETSVAASRSPVDPTVESGTSEKDAPLQVPEKDAPKKQEKNQLVEPPRLRGESHSTVDTALMDTSFEETSEGSGFSGRSTPIQPASVDSTERTASARSNRGRKSRGVQAPRTTTTARSRKSEHNVKGKNTPPAVVSRWDALKPANGNDVVLDGIATKGNRKNLKGTQTRACRNGKATSLPQPDSTALAPQISAAPIFESRTSTHTPPARVPPPTTTDSFWLNNDMPVVPSTDHTALMTSFLEENNRGRSSPADPTTSSTLNPHSPPFAPSQVVGLRPPPGLTQNAPPGFGNSNSMEPLLLPPPEPSAGCSVPGLTLPSGCNSPSFLRPRENPFVDDDEDEQIAAELQELGGQMVGSILDF